MFLSISNAVTICTEDMGRLIAMIKTLISVARIVIVIGAIIYGCIDYFKVVIGDADKEMKKANTVFRNRLIALVVIFMLSFIVTFTIDLVASNTNDSDKTEWQQCWNEYNYFGKPSYSVEPNTKKSKQKVLN